MKSGGNRNRNRNRRVMECGTEWGGWRHLSYRKWVLGWHAWGVGKRQRKRSTWGRHVSEARHVKEVSLLLDRFQIWISHKRQVSWERKAHAPTLPLFLLFHPSLCGSLSHPHVTPTPTHTIHTSTIHTCTIHPSIHPSCMSLTS